jgi:hypothetical protein
MTRDAIMPALPMPYNGGRVDSASRAFSPNEGRGARNGTCEAQRATNTTKRSASKRHKLQESYRGKDNSLEYT